MTQLKLYGENAFTFLLFNEVNSGAEKLTKLLEELKRFDKPKSKFLDAERKKEEKLYLNKEPEIWLFPSFGKRSGFGEPDALLLVDRYVFWFEVETMFDLGRSGRSKAKDSLRQLYRFHCAARAFARSPKRKDGHLVIEGRTITNEDKCRDARLRLRGHGAAGLLARLKTACATGNSHYVLLSVDKPKPSGGSDFHGALKEMALPEFDSWDRKLNWPAPDKQCLQPDHCWYAYWSGDLNRFFKVDLLVGYVPIKKGS